MLGALAADKGVRALFYEGVDYYRVIPLDGSPFALGRMSKLDDW